MRAVLAPPAAPAKTLFDARLIELSKNFTSAHHERPLHRGNGPNARRSPRWRDCISSDAAARISIRSTNLLMGRPSRLAGTPQTRVHRDTLRANRHMIRPRGGVTRSVYYTDVRVKRGMPIPGSQLVCPLIPDLSFENALSRNSVSRARTGYDVIYRRSMNQNLERWAPKQEFGNEFNMPSQTRVWQHEEKENR
jgi:hypothetical protein